MGALQAGLKTTLQNAVSDLQTKIQALGTSWTALVAAQAAARTTDDGTVYLGTHGAPVEGYTTTAGGAVTPNTGSDFGLRLDDVLSKAHLARLATDSMLANGLRPVLEGFAKQEGSGIADITVTVSNVLSGH